MTKEDYELMFIDMCGRLPYGVKVEEEVYSINTDRYITHSSDEIDIENTRPYLFPMHNMTEEQYKQYIKCNVVESLDWLNRNHFDYRGLIDRGLAIDATNKNIYS